MKSVKIEDVYNSILSEEEKAKKKARHDEDKETLSAYMDKINSDYANKKYITFDGTKIALPKTKEYDAMSDEEIREQARGRSQ